MDLVTGAMGSLLAKLGELLKEELSKQVKEELSKQVKEEYKLQRGLREQVQSLLGELEIMHASLCMVAEVPHEQLNPPDKIWARDIRELSYDMEDVIDTFLVRVEDGREATPNPHWLKELVKKMDNLFSQVSTRYQTAHAIENIMNQVQEVAKKRRRYTIDSIVATPAASTRIDPQLEALYRKKTELVGIDGKRDQELIKLLSKGDDVSNKKLKIVSVVGFGGLGKTTLAKAVYDKLEQGFKYRAFVPVGRNPDMKKVFRDILIDLDKKKYTNFNITILDERQLINELQEFLEDKRYLIIIDDIWDEEHWNCIKYAFSNENNLDSRLIMTTRNLSVSEACCSSNDDIIVYKMEPLSDDDSQRLFYRRIFADGSECPRELKQVSRDILKKCGGVPLAIITIASLLASNKQINWYTVLNSIGCGLTGFTEKPCVKKMHTILSLSYYDLPSHLKTCLLYLRMFPEDYEINRDRLVCRWIAEGFVQPAKQGTTSLFELGEDYFNELINRSMIQPADIDKAGNARACRVHDMVLDLIYALSSQENFVTILDGTEQSMPNSQSKVRRLSLQNCKEDETTPLVSMSQVRSITIFPPAINLMPPLSSFDVLRVLDLQGCDLGKSINIRDVGNLFHLRYLGLARTGIRELPEEIGKLQFLQVLDVNYNKSELRELPSTIVKLRRLMCLLVEFRTRLPDGMGNLTSIEVLDWISTKGCSNIVKELCNLTRLRELRIFFSADESTKELEGAFVESLCNLHNIHSLGIDGYFGSMDLLGERWEPDQYLRRFQLQVSTSTGEIGTFSTLPACVKMGLSLLSELHIDVKELRQEDLQILGSLKALASLHMRSTHQTQRLLVLGGDDWFQSMMRFCFLFWSSGGHLMFGRGALPRAQEVLFSLNVRMAKDDGNSDSGLGNLLSLRRATVIIFRDGATVWEAKEAEAALRHAVDTHPNHPTIDIQFSSNDDEMNDFNEMIDFNEIYDFNEMNDFICDGEESAGSDDDYDDRRVLCDRNKSAVSESDDDEETNVVTNAHT